MRSSLLLSYSIWIGFLNVLKGGLPAFKMKPPLSAQAAKACPGRAFSFFSLCSALAKFRFSLSSAPERCSFIITGSPAPLQQKVAQKFRALGNAYAPRSPDSSLGNHSAPGREKHRSPSTHTLRIVHAHWAFVRTVLMKCEEDEPAQPELFLRFVPRWRTLRCRSIYSNRCFILAISNSPMHLL